MSADSTVTIPSHILSQSLNDETVVLDMKSGMYFGLSPVASSFWKLLNDGKSPDEIQSILLDEFDIDPETLKVDLDALLAQLETKKLIARKTA